MLFVSCDILKKDADDESGGVSEEELTAFFFENQDAPYVMFDAFSRVLMALDGTPVDGVSFTPRAGTKAQLIYDGVIGLDFDYDGTYEVSVIGYIDFPGSEANLDSGATLYITNVTGSAVDGTAMADVTAAGPGSAFLDGTGSFRVSGQDPVDLDFQATVNFFQSTINGGSGVVWGDWEADMYFEPSLYPPYYQVHVVTADGDDYIIGAGLF
jgi:hypothetical protein